MRASPPLLTVASAALLFAAWPFTAHMASIPGAVALVGLAILLATSASGGANAVSTAYAAVGVLAAGAVSPGPSAVAGALLLAAAYGERTLRVHGRTAKLVHVAAAACGGAVAGAVVVSFAEAQPAVQAVAVVVAAVVAAIPHLVAADDLVANALDAVAREVGEPVKGALIAGADLRRNADDALLDRATSRTVRGTWRALVRLAEARLRVQRSRAMRRAAPSHGAADGVLAMLDARISDHVAAIACAYCAVDAVRAAELGLDDAALRTAQSAGEALDQVTSAIVDVEP
jgi:hypothetical protein